MSQISPKFKRIHLNKVCRTCLSERGHLREIFSTRIPFMMEACASVRVTEDDGLPPHICLSCFHQIAKLYAFKNKIEESDHILREYIKQNKLKDKEHKEYLDILDMAVNDAQIEEEQKNITDMSEDDTPLSERQAKMELKKKKRSKRKIKQENDWSGNDATQISCEVKSESDSFTFDEGPPPLVPLASADVTQTDTICTIRILPQDAPPLIPIKPLTALKPSEIVNALGESLQVQSDLKFQCSMCKEEFSSLVLLRRHITNNCQPSELQCNICKKEFNDRKRLISHLKAHMVPKNYRCRICGKCYPSPSTFRVHMRTHTGERPFKCQICNKGFVRWAGVSSHMRTHNSVKPYVCKTCGRGFKILSNLERHKILHTGNFPYCCNYCGKTFSQSDNLQLHIRTNHTHERPYLCSQCGKGFVSSTRLNRHMWVHSGYKPYQCKQCPKAYSNSNDYKNHVNAHTGAAHKPYACESCNLRFYHPCRLAKHMKTHEFPCTECLKTFSSDELLNKHITEKHIQFFDDMKLPVSVQEVFVDYQ